MAKKVLWLGLATMGIFILSGCTTVSKNDGLLNQGLRNRVLVLQTQLDEKDNEINSLKEAIAKSDQGVNLSVQDAGEMKERPNNKQVQLALVNAGYYQGTIDGKIGRKTILAIKAFQKANNLSADGKIGKRTWALLKEYLEKKVK